MNRRKINNILTELYKTQWKTVFNELDKQYTDKVIEIASDYEILRQTEFAPLLIDGYELNYKLKNEFEIMDEKDFWESLYTNNKYIERYNSLTKKMEKELLKCCKKIKDYYEEIQDIVIPFSKKLSDADEIFNRLGHLKGKWFNMLLTFECNKIGESCTIFNENASILNEKRIKLIEDLERKLQEIKNQTEYKPSKGQEYKKIFDYKEMNRLAETSGYIFSRFTGDHKVYLHKNTNKIVVIPQHELKFGIMCNIQKQIINNAKSS